MTHAKHATGDGKPGAGDRQGGVIELVIGGKQLDGEPHGGSALGIPTHVHHFTVYKANKLDVAAATVQENKVIFPDQGLAARNNFV